MDEQAPDIRLPDLLDPERQVVSSRGDWVDHNRKDLIPALEGSIAELCAYGQRLWNDANDMRTYLLRHQPDASPATEDPDREAFSRR